MSIQIINRSQWPTPALKVLAQWVASRAGIEKDRPYELTFRSTDRTDWYHGTGNRYRQAVYLNRRFQPASGSWPMTRTDHRFKWATEELYQSRLELLVGLIAHETHHAMGGHPDHFRKGMRTDKAAMEFRCNRIAQETVAAFRVEWPCLRAKIKRAMRTDRDRRKARIEKLRARRADPRPKLVSARTMYKKWQGKAKLAATKMKKYRRQIQYYEGRAAAKTASLVERLGPDAT